MKVVTTLQTQNEADLLVWHLQYHLQLGVDHICVTNHHSTDHSEEVLKAFAGSGKVSYRNESDPAQRQGQWVSEMNRQAVTVHGADWVIHLDTDEFLVMDNQDLKEWLSGLPTDGLAFWIKRHDFVPISIEVLQSPLLHMIYQKVFSTNLKGQPLPPKAFNRGRPEIQVSNGNHQVFSHGEPLANRYVESASLYHFPIRDYLQFENKASGGRAWALNENRGPGESYHKLYWHALQEKQLLKKEFETFYYPRERLELAVKYGILKKNERLADLLKEMPKEPPFSHFVAHT